MTNPSFYIHPTAEVSPDAQIGAGTRIWRQAQVREHAQIGETCNIGKGAYIDAHVHIGSNVKIQNNVSLFEGVTLEDGVFVGPHVCFTNDMLPRAITPEGKLKSIDDWEITPTLVKYGASIGAGSIIICGLTIGEFALIALELLSLVMFLHTHSFLAILLVNMGMSAAVPADSQMYTSRTAF